MAGKNENLHKAKDEKSVEFYTLLSDIQTELSNYIDKFQGKIVYCNCDDPFESNFVKYFLMNFNRLKLKELIATGYSTSPIRGTELDIMSTAYVLRVKDTRPYLVGTQKDLDAAGAKYFLTAEKDTIASVLIGNDALDKNGNPIQISIKEKYIDGKGKTRTRTVKQNVYYEAGDFRSDMSVELLKQADIVVTNPPFALFREYLGQLIEYNKQFIIIGNKNCITYKEVFPLIRDNKLWLGNTSMSRDMLFTVPKTYEEYLRKTYKNGSKYRIVNGKFYARAAAVWFTNIDHAKRHVMLPLDMGYVYEGHEDMYPKYDNYDAINVDKVSQIPCDYKPCWFECPYARSCKYAQTQGKEDGALCEQACNGEMGVPISYLDKHCPEQMEIIGADFDVAAPMRLDNGKVGHDRFYVTRERERLYSRIVIRRMS